MKLTDEQLNRMITIAAELPNEDDFQLYKDAVNELHRLKCLEKALQDHRSQIVRSYFALRCSSKETLQKYLASELLEALGKDLINAVKRTSGSVPPETETDH